MKRLTTGTPGLDTLLQGGIPAGRTVLVSGTTGTGKTILGAQFLAAGVAQGEPGVLLSLEQDAGKLKEDLASVAIDVDQLKESGTFEIIGGAIGHIQHLQSQAAATPADVLAEIGDVIERLNAKRVVIDSINLFFMLFQDPDKRDALAALTSLLSKYQVTALLTAEVPEGSRQLAMGGFEEFVVDGVIGIYRFAYANTFERALSVVKMRGGAHSKAVRAVTITGDGLVVHPDQEPYHNNIAGQ